MTKLLLRFGDPAKASVAARARGFFWTRDGSSSIDARLVHSARMGPRLGALGPLEVANVDFVRIAVAVFAADRSVPREGGGANWNRRQIHLRVPLLDPAPWRAHAAAFKAVVDLLSGDNWNFDFIGGRTAQEPTAEAAAAGERVVLLSGGADSAAGALISRAELPPEGSHTLVSHYSSNMLPQLQRQIAEAIEGLLPGRQQRHVQARLTRVRQRADGSEWPDETSSRSRSLLFVALGLAVASKDGAPLWIPENGFASLNPPLGPERLGAVSTRTTHPAFLAGLRDVLAAVGAHSVIDNPFAYMTKGEMFARAAELVGANEASVLLSRTNSCAHTGQRAFGFSIDTPCGVCFGCVVRRASFAAAGLDDRTSYMSQRTAPNTRAGRWLARISVEEAIRRFAQRGITSRDIIAMGLPSSMSVADAQALTVRGIAELKDLLG